MSMSPGGLMTGSSIPVDQRESASPVPMTSTCSVTMTSKEIEGRDKERRGEERERERRLREYPAIQFNH